TPRAPFSRRPIVQPPPQLTIIPSGTNVILTWPTNFAGFDYTGFILQSTTNLVSPGGWSAVSPGPVVINGQSTVTNPLSGVRKFYRLSQSPKGSTMKTRIKNLSPCLAVASLRSRILPALLAGLGLPLTSRVAAQTFTNLHSFTAVVSATNSDGANPSCSLILSGNTLYGTTEDGGTNGKSTVFAINPAGNRFTNVYSFSATATNALGTYTNRDGTSPAANLILAGNTFYGTAEFGGLHGHGTVFALHTDGTSFTNLYSFSAVTTNDLGRYTNSDGTSPQCGLVMSGNVLYGTASSGGPSGNGTVFRVNADGTSFTNLHG